MDERQHFCLGGLPQVQGEERHEHFRAVAEDLHEAGVVEERVHHEKQGAASRSGVFGGKFWEENFFVYYANTI